MKDLEYQLRQLRLQRGLTQTEVGKILGIGKSAYSSYERGVSAPSPAKLEKLANFYNVSIDTLMGNDTSNSIDIKDALNNLLKNLNSESAVITYDGDYVNDELRGLLITNIKNLIQIATVFSGKESL